MLDFIDHHVRLGFARMRKRKIRRKHRRDLAKAHRENQPVGVFRKIGEEKHEKLLEVNDEIRHFVCDRILHLADTFMLPIPEFKREDGDWEQLMNYGGWALKPEALNTLRTAIRKEQKERSEHLISWLTPITGILGAATGLVAVMLAG